MKAALTVPGGRQLPVPNASPEAVVVTAVDQAVAPRSRTRFDCIASCIAVALIGLQACKGGPSTEATEAIGSPQGLAVFKERIAPRLGPSCGGEAGGGCHAQRAAPAVDMGPEDHPEGAWFFPVDEKSGRLDAREQIETTYRLLLTPRETMTGEMAARVDLRTEPRFSMALRKPLSESAGGVIHGGGDIFTSTQDPLYRAIYQWIELERQQGKMNEEPLQGGQAGKFFKDKVLPVLVNNSCMTTSCHEINHTNLRFDHGVVSDDPSEPLSTRFDNALANRNRATSLGLITNQLFLTGDVAHSRFLRKALRLSHGGVLHKGGNNQFLDGLDDPDYQTLLEWARLERQELLSKVRTAGEPVPEALMGAVRGLVFVRMPKQNHRRFLDVGRYQPGGDIWLLRLGPNETLATASSPPVNLTARFHEGRPADVREPELRHDGRSLLFAMRVGEDDNLNIYELELDGDLAYVEGSFRRLTYGPKTARGVKVHFTDPTYVPCPDDDNALVSGYNLERADIVYATNIDGEVAPAEEYGVLGEVDGGDSTTITDWERFEPDGSYVGRRIFVKMSHGRMTEIRTIKAWEHGPSLQPARPTRIVLDRPLSTPVVPGDHYIIDRDNNVAPEFLPAYSLYVMKRAPRGEEQSYYAAATRFTFSPNHELDTSVRSTGEVYFASLRNTGYSRHKPIFNVGRNRRHLDKAMSFPTHRGNRSRVRIIADFHEMPGGNDIFVGMAPETVWEAGNLYLSDHQIGCAFEEGNPVDGVTYLCQGPEQRGRSATPSHPRMIPPMSPIFPLIGSDGVTDHGLSPGGAFRDPWPLNDGSVMVSYAAGAVRLADPQQAPNFDLYVLQPEPGFYGEPGGLSIPKTKLVPIPAASTPDFAEVQAIPVTVRFKERMRAAKREDKNRYVRGPQAKDAPADTRPGMFCERNYRVIDGFIDENVPAGRHIDLDGSDPVTGETLPEIERLAYIRLVAGSAWTRMQVEGLDPGRVQNQDPHSTWVSNGVHPAKLVMAEVPVDASGNVCFPMVPDTPYLYQSLNSDRMALRSLNRWFWVAPTEMFGASVLKDESYQQCAACHGAMTGKAIDTYGTMDLDKVGGCSASCHKPNGMPPDGDEMMPMASESNGMPPAERLHAGIPLVARDEMLSVTFLSDVQPIIKQHCVACHNGSADAAPPNLSLEPTAYYNQAYESLMALASPGSGNYDDKFYVAEREALAIESYLVEKIYGKELRAPRQLSGDVPHPSASLLERHKVEAQPLTDAERLTIVRWIDLGAVFRSAPAAEQAARSQESRKARKTQ